MDALQPVSFVYNQATSRVRYGFIAEDTAAVDAHLATYDASGTVSGIDDRSILAVLVGAIKELWAKVLALIASDEAQNARIEQLEEEVAALKAAAGAATVGETGAPGGSPTDGAAAGGASSTTPAVDEQATTDSLVDDPEPADAPALGEGEAPADLSEGGSDTGGPESTTGTDAPPVPQDTPEAANDNDSAPPSERNP